MLARRHTNRLWPAWGRLSRRLGWTRDSYWLISAFSLTLLLLAYVWWPLATDYLDQVDWQGAWWRYIDWLLLTIFLFMSALLMAGANLRRDSRYLLVGILGGLVIESWGTQTEIWTYYTHERPPLWIIPAWPIAGLSIDRLTRWLERVIPRPRSRHQSSGLFVALYWVIFPLFLAVMVPFVWPTIDQSFTRLALLVCLLLILTPTDHRLAILTFAAGAGLGYFLELWGTTRLCWTYYTGATPPLFAVLAHGMAAVAFWRSVGLLDKSVKVLQQRRWRGSKAGRGESVA